MKSEISKENKIFLTVFDNVLKHSFEFDGSFGDCRADLLWESFSKYLRTGAPALEYPTIIKNQKNSDLNKYLWVLEKILIADKDLLNQIIEAENNLNNLPNSIRGSNAYYDSSNGSYADEYYEIKEKRENMLYEFWNIYRILEKKLLGTNSPLTHID